MEERVENEIHLTKIRYMSTKYEFPWRSFDDQHRMLSLFHHNNYNLSLYIEDLIYFYLDKPFTYFAGSQGGETPRHRTQIEITPTLKNFMDTFFHEMETRYSPLFEKHQREDSFLMKVIMVEKYLENSSHFDILSTRVTSQRFGI